VGFDHDYRPKPFYADELYADDTAAVRAAFPPGVKLRDGLISSYVTYYSDFLPQYLPARPAVAAVRAGKTFSLTAPIKIENTGTAPLAKLMVEVYLAPQRLSFTGAVLVKRLRLAGTIRPGATQKLNVGAIRVPPGVPAGTYYVAFFLRDPQDAYQGNNGAWSGEEETVTVIRP
jgi:hypothetical protein